MKARLELVVALGSLIQVATASSLSRLVSPGAAPLSLRTRELDQGNNFNLTILHVNDVHAHLDEYRISGAACTNSAQGCLGGYARIKEKVDQIRPLSDHTLLLDIGDEFQGTLFFSVLGAEPIADTINQLGFDAFVPGNHEYDRGSGYLAEFLANLTFPTVCANLETNNTALRSLVKPYHIFEDLSVAVIGLTTNTTTIISNPGAGTTFTDHVTSMQAQVDEIRSTTDVKRIVAMTHIGYAQDQLLAQNTRGVYMIVGGHSHTLLGDMSGAAGPYPTVVKNLDGEDVFIVQAHRWGDYLGYIEIEFDPAGRVVAYKGGPISMDNSTSLNATLDAQIKHWAAAFAPFEAQVVGVSLVDLDQTLCQKQECLQGDVLADAMLEYVRNNSSTGANVALINAGTVRSGIDAGNVTMGDILTSYPFGNAVTTLDLTGSEMVKMFESIASARSEFNGEAVTSFVQVSANIVFVYNPQAAVGSRLVSLEIDGKEIDEAGTYTIVTSDYVAGGGDNFLPEQSGFEVLDTLDQIFAAYVTAHSPLNPSLDGRIAVASSLSFRAQHVSH